MTYYPPLFKTFNLCLVSLFMLLSGTAAYSNQYDGQKILLLHSYHAGYEWTDGVTKGVKQTLAETGAELKIFYMDTKNHPTENDIKTIALKAKVTIDNFKPAVVISSDDNAAKYVIMPFYKGGELPIVFCGVNWDASPYGLPAKNVTGMIEVDLITAILKQLKEHANGQRLGFMAFDGMAERKYEIYYKKLFNISFTQTAYVKTFADWKKSFLELQEQVDILIINNFRGIPDWENETAAQFVEENTRIPTGTTFPWVASLALLGISYMPEEHGIWSAETALRIIDGVKPSEIAITENKQGKLFINLRIGNKLKIFFKSALLEKAEIIR